MADIRYPAPDKGIELGNPFLEFDASGGGYGQVVAPSGTDLSAVKAGDIVRTQIGSWATVKYVYGRTIGLNEPLYAGGTGNVKLFKATALQRANIVSLEKKGTLSWKDGPVLFTNGAGALKLYAPYFYVYGVVSGMPKLVARFTAGEGIRSYIDVISPNTPASWAYVRSNGDLLDGHNISYVQRLDAGAYRIGFKRSFYTTNYGVITMPASEITTRSSSYVELNFGEDTDFCFVSFGRR